MSNESASREMTLEEFIKAKLPPTHRASKEFDALKSVAIFYGRCADNPKVTSDGGALARNILEQMEKI